MLKSLHARENSTARVRAALHASDAASPIRAPDGSGKNTTKRVHFDDLPDLIL